MPKIDLSRVTPRTGSIYPAPYDAEMAGRSSLRVGDAGGLTQFGANIVILAPGAKSSLRHWHERQDEFVMVIHGACTLIDDDGEHHMQAGDCATFPAGDGNGHHLVNHTAEEARFLVIGTRTPEEAAWYSDIDLKVTMSAEGAAFTRKDGTPYKGDDK
ncbi:cupin domain-containing protein [Sediminimonas qiaohouensis]|uniref:cupin domain-containing protein n=1 Tax=Sediminimonas qiaohouensis TaxID=552061 RepID=UPI0003F7BDD9|nr:cupin domain-containing protein [Sediminimonas qiaohouensis]